MKVLFVGDIVGKSGRNALQEHLPFLRNKYGFDLLIVNGENSAHGKGITQKIYNSFVEQGVDVVTLGNHAFSKDNIFSFLTNADKIIRPVNMEPLNVGKSCKIIDFNGLKVGVYNIYGNAYMENSTEKPITAMLKLVEYNPADIKIVDIHAETTGEKVAFMQYFKHDVQMIVGTHTHIQTADEGIYDNCAYITDVGMTGLNDGALGFDIDSVTNKIIYGKAEPFKIPDEGKGVLSAVVMDIDEISGKAQNIFPIYLQEE